MNYAVLLSQTDEPAKIIQCESEEILKACYRLIGCRTVQLVPRFDESRLPAGYEALCDEDIFGKTVFINPLASWIYGTDIHGTGINGNVVILKIVETEDGADLAFMTEEEAQKIADQLNQDYEAKYNSVLFAVMSSRITE